MACFLVVTVVTSGMAMAAYACPQVAKTPVQEMAMGDMPCAEMDQEKPVHCAEQQSGAMQLALEHLAAAPTLTPLVSAFVIPVLAPVVPTTLISFRSDVPSELGAEPPYLRTQRLRI